MSGTLKRVAVVKPVRREVVVARKHVSALENWFLTPNHFEVIQWPNRTRAVQDWFSSPDNVDAIPSLSALSNEFEDVDLQDTGHENWDNGTEESYVFPDAVSPIAPTSNPLTPPCATCTKYPKVVFTLNESGSLAMCSWCEVNVKNTHPKRQRHAWKCLRRPVGYVFCCCTVDTADDASLIEPSAYAPPEIPTEDPSLLKIMYAPQASYVLFVCGWECALPENCSNEKVASYIQLIMECETGSIASICVKNNYAFVSYHKKSDADRVMYFTRNLTQLTIQKKRAR